MARQQTVSPEAPMPKGYEFLKKGNPFMTRLCRRKTLDARKTLYVVVDHGKQEGLRAPKWILHQVLSEEKATREKRRSTVERQDAATEDAFATAIKRRFARIPEEDLNSILRHALRKRSGRVGRAGRLGLDKKAYLAVQAYVRHCHTDYDEITKASKDRNAARDAIRGEVARVLAEWGGDPAVTRLGNAVRKDNKGETQKRRPSLTAATKDHLIKPAAISRPAIKQRFHSLASKETATQSQPVVIDLTQDEDEAEEGDATDQVSSGEKEQDEEEDDSDAWSDSVDSDKEYQINDLLD